MKHLLWLCVFAIPAMSEIPWKPEAIADAIYRAEGGSKTRWPYGVKSVKTNGEAHARRVCLNTIDRAAGEWKIHGRVRHGCFIKYLSLRYCPPSLDPDGNRNWVKNVLWFLR